MTTSGTWDLETFTAAVGDAVWAPSIHNSQPWVFRPTATGIDLLVDRGRLLPAADPDGRAARVSCGAAAFNLALALAVTGTPAVCTIATDGMTIHLTPDRPRPATPLERRLARQIRRRHTNRSMFADTPVEPGALVQLTDAAGQEGGWLQFVEDEPALESVAGLVRQADAQLRTDAAYVAEFRKWIRDADDEPDGVGRRAAGGAPHPGELMARRDFGGPERDTTRDPTVSPVVAVLGVQGDRPYDETQAGMALQRVLLVAADLGLATAMYSQPIEVPAVREQLRQTLHRPHPPQLILRFGYAPTTCYTNRRPLGDVITAHPAGLTG